MFSLAHRDPGAEEAGPGVSEEVRHLELAAHLFLAGEPLDEPTHRWIAEALGKPVIDHYWQTETGWPILTAVPGRGADAEQASAARRFPRTATTCSSCARPTRRRRRHRRERSRGNRAAAAAGRDVDGVGRRRALRQDLLRDVRDEAGVLDLRLGHPRQGRLLLHPRTHRRRHQRRRAPPGHARDRGGGFRRIRTSPRWPWSAWPTSSRGRCRSRSRWSRTRAKVASPEGRAAQEKEVMATVDRLLGAIARPARVHFVDAAAEDALGEASAPLDPGARRGARPGRSDDDRGSRRAGADQDRRRGVALTSTAVGRPAMASPSGSSATPSARSRCRPARLWGAQTQRLARALPDLRRAHAAGADPRARAGQARLRGGERDARRARPAKAEAIVAAADEVLAGQARRGVPAGRVADRLAAPRPT